MRQYIASALLAGMAHAQTASGATGVTPAPTAKVTLSAAEQKVADIPDPGALVWIFLIAYLVAVLSIAAYGFVQKVILKKKVWGKDENTTEVEDHFIGGRGFSPTLLAMTTFASVYSGYTVVGVPSEAYSTGYSAYRWLIGVYPFVYPFAFFMSRLNFLAHLRRYISPSDFMVDRYRSRMIRALTSICLAIPALIYVCTQFRSMGATVQAMSDGKIEAFHAAIFFAVVMLLYEVFGGLRGIAYTDALQGGVLFCSFLLFFPVQGLLFGGTPDVARHMSKTGQDGIADNQITAWFGFLSTMTLGFMLNPHLMVRYQAGRSPTATKWTMAFLGVGAWITMLCSALTGLCALKHFGPGLVSSEIFGHVVRYTISQGTFYNILGSIMLSASVAAFMSTADSALHATSSCLTLDLVYPLLQTRIADEGKRDFIASCIGYLMSFIVAVLALIASQNDIPFGALLTVQNALLMVLTPGYVLGFLWKGTKPYAVLLGMMFSLFFYIGWQCSAHHIEHNFFEQACTPVGGAHAFDWYGPIPYVHPSIFCLIINIIIVVGLSVLPAFPAGVPFAFDQVTYPETDAKSTPFPIALVGLDLSQVGGPELRPWYGKQGIMFLVGLNLSWFLVPWYWTKETPELKERDFYPGWLITVMMVLFVQSIIFLTLVVNFWSTEDYKLDDDNLTEQMKENKTFDKGTSDL